MIDDQTFLKAVLGLRDRWGELFGKDDARTLSEWMAETSLDDPEAARQTADRVLALLQRHPQAKAQVSAELGIKGTLEFAVRGAPKPIPGETDQVPASILMVCPVDPAHYRRRLRQKGQTLFCPQHGVALVFEPIAGVTDQVPTGTIMVCPVDSCNYRQRLRQKGKALSCPHHDVELVPEDQVKPKE